MDNYGEPAVVRKISSDEPSEVVVEAVAEAADVSVGSVGPLYNAIDPDALDALFRNRGSEQCYVTFPLGGCTVKMYGNERVVVWHTENSEDAITNLCDHS